MLVLKGTLTVEFNVMNYYSKTPVFLSVIDALEIYRDK